MGAAVRGLFASTENEAEGDSCASSDKASRKLASKAKGGAAAKGVSAKGGAAKARGSPVRRRRRSAISI